MDTVKIGKYIAQKRKNLGLTQRDIAEQLGMSDKSVSKWERGVCLPDVSVYMELCRIIGISLNEFIAGEDIEQVELQEKSEQNILNVTKDGNYKKRRLKAIIAVLVCICVAVTSLSGYLLWKRFHVETNYIEPFDENSAEMRILKLVDAGPFVLYKFSTDKNISQATVMITCYEKGEKKYKHDVMTYGFKSDNVSDRADTVDSVIKVSSENDSNEKNDWISVTVDEGKATFDLIEDDVELTGYMCAWADEKEHVDIVKGEEIEFLRISYGMDHVEAIMPGASIGNNEYMYSLSVRFE
mgnify:FL=1